ncbi:MAG: tetratricopeptide repeat protein [bacterium]
MKQNQRLRLLLCFLLPLATAHCALPTDHVSTKQTIQHVVEEKQKNKEIEVQETENLPGTAEHPSDLPGSIKRANNQKMIHLIKSGDGTLIELWIDPLEDDFEVDLQFSGKDKNNALPEVKANGGDKGNKMNKDVDHTMSHEANSDIDQYIILYETAQKLFYLNQYDDALKNVNEAIRISPHVALGYKLKGSIYYMLKEKTKALTAWEQAFKLDPKAEDVREKIAELKGEDS